MKVIIGARDLWPTPAVAARILSIMISTDEAIAVRGNLAGATSSPTEEVALRIAKRIGRDIVRFEPHPTEGNGRNWLRDQRLVSESSEVFAFYAADGTEGGTEHVVTVALRTGKPVVAYGMDGQGAIIELGSDDGIFQAMAEYDGEIGWNR